MTKYLTRCNPKGERFLSSFSLKGYSLPWLERRDGRSMLPREDRLLRLYLLKVPEPTQTAPPSGEQVFKQMNRGMGYKLHAKHKILHDQLCCLLYTYDASDE